MDWYQTGDKPQTVYDATLNWRICMSLSLKKNEAEWRIYEAPPKAIIGSDNGLSPVRRQAIICTNYGLLSIGPLGTYFGEIWVMINQFSLKKMNLKMSSAKWPPFCLGLSVRPQWGINKHGRSQQTIDKTYFTEINFEGLFGNMSAIG